MKNFDWTKFSKRIYLKSDLKTVYNVWTKSAELEKWFLSKAVFLTNDRKEILPTENVDAGCIYRWNWFAQNAFEEGKIIKANGTDSLTFTFAGTCSVEVQLTQVENQILVELVQSQIPSDDSSKENIRLGCAFGWSFYLLNLKSILEGGIDLRNKDTSLIGVVNN
ncbi:SRPBCC family protein [Crocinitomix catalasitica]|uniref:SRPBCC family protein n=1 Tax=Crocinitomix catalasitica TaxID=184607 RepID=UPI0004813FD9|nr:SRPBCC domain-containing protein [Crocinitomix catalasitica]